MSDITRILTAIDQGDAQAADELLPMVYEELRRLAAQKLSHEKPGQTLQATALVHEAYLRLVGCEDQHWDSRGHFFAAAAEAMRRILVDRVRHKRSVRHGQGFQRVELDESEIPTDAPNGDLIALDEALSKLATQDKTAAELVKLRYFAGLTVEQAAKALGVSRATADRNWSHARAWLYHEISRGDEQGERDSRIVCRIEIMNKDKKPNPGREDPKRGNEIRSGGKFSLAKAIGRLGGGDLLKGTSPVPRKRQAELEIERYLEQHLVDSDGAVEVVLLRRVRESEAFLKEGYQQPLSTLARMVERLLGSEPLLQNFVNEVDREWGRLFLERPHFQKPDSPPHPEDPYTFASVRKALTGLVAELRSQ